MKTLAFFGCGRLSTIVAKAITDNILTGYTVIGTQSLYKEDADRLAAMMNTYTGTDQCKSCSTIDELIALKPDYIVEAASPDALQSMALKALSNGVSIVTLSIGGLADETFYEEVAKTAQENNAKVHIASGAIGGFDVLRTASLMGPSTVTFETEKGPNSLRYTPVYDDALQTEERLVFTGNAKEAIAMFPHQVNVSVAASLASIGPANTKVSVTSKPGYIGDKHCITLKNEQIHAVVDIYSSTPQIAGWSVVNTLRNIVSPIVF